MRKLIFSMVLIFASWSLSGQNLVPNCDFDLYTSCPNATGQFDRARDWYTPGEGTSDYCNSCSAGAVGVPGNQWGYEEPYSGQGYGHIICYYPFQGNDYREYMQVRLVCPLVAGETYSVSFYVSLTDNSRYAIDGIGLLFTDLPITQSGDNVIDPGSPGHIYNTPGAVISQKDGWLQISGAYTAAGGEEYITIGSFVPENELTITILPGSTTSYSSFYVDMVTVRPMVPMDLLRNDTTLCYGESLLLQAPDLCSGTFAWDDGSSSLLRLVTVPGTYSISFRLGCSDLYDQLTLSWFPKPLLQLPQDTILCHNDSFWLQPGDFQSYLWQDGSQGPGFLVDKAGTYWVEITDEQACPYRDSVVVSWLEPPAVELGPDLSLCIGDSTTLTAGDENSYTTYLWQDNSMRPYLMVRQEGLYSVTATNPCGQAMDNILVGYHNCDPLLTVPNAFTPNGDGMNDSFRATGINISSYRLQVFNRWGELIFTSSDPGTGWDGTKNGKPCSGDVYVWTIYYESDALEVPVSETVRGTVVLIR